MNQSEKANTHIDKFMHSNSLERWLNLLFFIISSLISGLVILCIWLAEASHLILVSTFLFLLIAQYVFISWAKNSLLRPYFNI